MWEGVLSIEVVGTVDSGDRQLIGIVGTNVLEDGLVIKIGRTINLGEYP